MARKPGSGPKRVPGPSGPSGLGRSMTEEEAFEFLLGVWVDTPSSCVLRVRYDAGEMRLDVAFKDRDGNQTAEVAYQGVSLADAQSLAGGSSVGCWVDQNLKKTGKPFYYLT